MGCHPLRFDHVSPASRNKIGPRGARPKFRQSPTRSSSADDLLEPEVQRDLAIGGSRLSDPCERVLALRDGKQLADRTVGGFLRIGGTHYFAILRDGIIAFEYLQDDRTEVMKSHSSP